MADITWPSSVLKATGGRVRIVSMNIGGGRAFSGGEQVVASDAGLYALTMGPIHVTSNEQVKAWNTMEAVLGGRSNTALVPALDCKRAPWPLVNGKPVTDLGNVPFSDGTFFDDGSGFGQLVIAATAESDIEAGAVAAVIRIARGGALEAGHHFSVGERLFRIVRILSANPSGQDVVYSVKLALPAREAVGAGSTLNFDNPMFRAVLATDDEMALDLHLFKFGMATINWVEDV